MVKAWMMDCSDGDQRLEHHLDPPQWISIQQLAEDLGVLYWQIDPEKDMDKLEEIKVSRGYSYSDEIQVSPEKLPNYEVKIKSFFEEHIHTDEEIRFILEGAGYFDVRDKLDRWVRILVEKNDLLVLPAGIYHRFTLDTKNYIKVSRLFVGEPVWTPHNRPSADQMEARKEYKSKYLTPVQS